MGGCNHTFHIVSIQQPIGLDLHLTICSTALKPGCDKISLKGNALCAASVRPSHCILCRSEYANYAYSIRSQERERANTSSCYRPKFHMGFALWLRPITRPKQPPEHPTPACAAKRRMKGVRTLRANSYHIPSITGRLRQRSGRRPYINVKAPSIIGGLSIGSSYTAQSVRSRKRSTSQKFIVSGAKA